MSGAETAAIELNDVGVIVEAGMGSGLPSPGIAFWDGARLRVGEEARRSQYLWPRQVNDSFWDRLSQEVLPLPLGSAVSAADLAYAHLESLWSPVASVSTRAIVALTAGFELERLGLFLGIAQSLSIPVVGVVDAAVLVAAGEEFDAVIHVDLQRHRSVITRVDCGETCVRGDHVVVDSLGWRSFMDRLATTVAASFVRRTRFDPLHHSDDEQGLHDRLATTLVELKESDEVDFELEAAGRTHAIRLRTRDFSQELAPLAASLVDRARALLRPGEAALCQLTSRVAELPGLAEAFRSGLDCEVVSLAEGAAARLARAQLPEIPLPEHRVPYVTRLATNPVRFVGAASVAGGPRGA